MPLSFPDSSVSSQDLVFSCDWCKEGGYMFLKKGGDIKKRGMKKKGRRAGGVGLIHLSSLWAQCFLEEILS